ncbi:phage regulatory CII family protein, partial [Pasteurella multocida]
NVDCEQNQLSFIEAIELIATVQSKKTLSAIAAQIDHIVVPMPRCADCGQDVLARFLDIAESSGRIGKEIKSAVSSDSELGRDLSQNEKEKILAEVEQLIEQAICLKMELGQ